MNYILKKIKDDIINNENISENINSLIDELSKKHDLADESLLYILNNISLSEMNYLFKKAYEVKSTYYSNRVYLRGLIEFSNYCKQGCRYCGINHTNLIVERYRLSKDEILECCDEGYKLGYRTFVLQSGEDNYYDDNMMCELIKIIKGKYDDVAITLSIGERSYESYQKLYDAGADRYLLRHETASKRLYDYLHPSSMSFENRIECLYNLKKIGYQVGAGFMVGSPSQTNEDLVKDLRFLKELEPHMIGIGPYLCHSDTVLKGNDSGTLKETLIMVALVRLLLPKALLPSTTALGTLDKLGREKALNAGANVMMPNISPTENREKYEIYQNKICTGDTADMCRNCVEGRISLFDHEVDLSRGDHIDIK